MSQTLKNKKILITGGAGFIGSNLTGYLLNSGNKITILDNFSTGKKENLKEFSADKNLVVIEGDIRDYDLCLKAASENDFVLHQAALGSVPRSIKDPKTTNDVNIGGFINMLIAAKECGIKRFVYAASSSTYGDHPALPKVEEQIGTPLSPYAITKYVNELYAQNFSKIYGIETIGLRYFNVFGPKQDPFGAYAAVIPLFIKQLKHHTPPRINGDGTHSRDFTFVENVIQANVLAIQTTNPEAVNTVYNVACGQRTNLIELVDMLKKNLSKFDPAIDSINPVFVNERPGDVKHSLASIDKITKLLGYTPHYNISNGIEKAIEWYWNNLE